MCHSGNALVFGPRGEVRGSHPGPATILLGTATLSKLILLTFLSFKKPGDENGVFELDRFNSLNNQD